MLGTLTSGQKPCLLLIGIDGADYHITDRLMGQGYLPNLKALAERGAWGPVRSTVPPLTPPAWTTLMTGKNPGKHGVFDFLPMDGQDPGVPVGARRRATTLWRALSDLGYRVGTLNLPVTYPPEPISGFQVSGFTAPAFGPAVAYPKRAFSVLRQAAQGFAPFPDPSGHPGEGERELRDRIDLVPIATRHLLQAFPCDVYMVNFQVVDWVQHRALPEEMKPGDAGSLDLDGLVARTYRLVDDRVGVVLREWASPQTHVMVTSDHGAAVVDRLVNLERLFLEEGLLFYKSATTGKSSGLAAARLRARVALGLWNALKRNAPRLAGRLAPLARRLRAGVSAYQADVEVDWSRTQAAPWGLYGQVRLNIRGRDPEGIVPPHEAPALKARVRELILSVRDPVSGEPVYRDVSEGPAIYSGPFVPEGPDLVALPADERYLTVCGRMFGGPRLPLLDAQDQTVVALDPPRDFHSCLGIFGLAGPGVEPGKHLPESSLADFVPTALYLLGEPVPSDMDGRPVMEAMRSETPRKRRVRVCMPWPEPEAQDRRVVYTKQEEKQVQEQLEALGYL